METPTPKKIKFTSVVRRGLARVRGLCLDSFDQSKAPSESVVKTRTKAQQNEFNAAMAWIEQEESAA